MPDHTDVHIHIHGTDDGRLRNIERLLHRLLEKDTVMALDLTELHDAVQRDTDATSSAVTLLSALAQEIRDAAGDPAAIEALAFQVEANASALAASVAANTTTGNTPPADTPPADTPPADQPPADQPPADAPPADQPPVDVPPAESVPADNGDQTPA